MFSTFQNSNVAETNLALIVGMVLASWMMWLAIKRINSGPKTPDPWSDEISAAVNLENAIPLCPHCLEPHDELEHICTHCGGPVGPCTNLMPPLYYLSLGHMLRMGTFGRFKVSPFLILGYFVAGTVVYVFLSPLPFLVPVYWFMLISNIGRLCRYDQTPESLPD